MAANPFDQFDATPAATGGNPFDQFDVAPPPPVKPATKPADKPSLGRRIADSDLGRGALDLVGGATNLLGSVVHGVAGVADTVESAFAPENKGKFREAGERIWPTVGMRTETGKAISGALPGAVEQGLNLADKASPELGRELRTALPVVGDVMALAPGVGAGAKAFESSAATSAARRGIADSSAIMGARTPLEKANALGVPLTAAERGAGPIARGVDVVAGRSKLQARNVETANKNLNRAARKDLGLSDGEILTQQELNKNLDELGKKRTPIADALGTIDLTSHPKFQSVVRDATTPAGTGEASAEALALVDHYSKVKPVGGKQLLADIQELRSDAARNKRSGVTATQRKGEAQQKIADAMDDLIEERLSQTNPDLVGLNREVRQKMAKNYTYSDALDGQNIDAQRMVASADRGEKSKRKFTGISADIADVGRNFPKTARSATRAPPSNGDAGDVLATLASGGADLATVGSRNAMRAFLGRSKQDLSALEKPTPYPQRPGPPVTEPPKPTGQQQLDNALSSIDASVPDPIEGFIGDLIARSEQPRTSVADVVDPTTIDDLVSRLIGAPEAPDVSVLPSRPAPSTEGAIIPNYGEQPPARGYNQGVAPELPGGPDGNYGPLISLVDDAPPNSTGVALPSFMREQPLDLPPRVPGEATPGVPTDEALNPRFASLLDVQNPHPLGVDISGMSLADDGFQRQLPAEPEPQGLSFVDEHVAPRSRAEPGAPATKWPDRYKTPNAIREESEHGYIAYEPKGDEWNINDAFVDEEHRGGGIGQANLLDLAGKAQAAKKTLNSDVSQTPAQARVYAKLFKTGKLTGTITDKAAFEAGIKNGTVIKAGGKPIITNIKLGPKAG